MEKEFNNTISPQIEKGKIVIFPHSGDGVDVSFIEIFCQKLGYKYLDEFGGGFLIETPHGEEDKVGKDFNESYPEFFQGYERRDLRYLHVNDKIFKISEDVNCIGDYIEYTDSRRFVDPIAFNLYIDKIINDLNSLKI